MQKQLIALMGALAWLGLVILPGTAQAFDEGDDPWVLLCVSAPGANSTTGQPDGFLLSQVNYEGPDVGDWGYSFYLWAHADFWQDPDPAVKGAYYRRVPEEANTSMWQYVGLGPFILGPTPEIQYGEDQSAGYSVSDKEPGATGTFELSVHKSTFTATQHHGLTFQTATAEWQFITCRQSYALAFQAAMQGLPDPTGNP